LWDVGEKEKFSQLILATRTPNECVHPA